MFGRMREDIRAMRERDPAATGWLEVLLCYPGLHAIWRIGSPIAAGLTGPAVGCSHGCVPTSSAG